ncbi:alpha/beta hydrolase family protein [Winogradskyella sp. SM1960]|uniref:alpha/beta hydrolase family protein n=1 Tax=Winogradskyella sp. SM1960 TaxID=2865955 RepID=UPI001CD80C93|nr:prolyl oligopeptidase family serine peptidase [Winogradskyella sp. SM1960]
MNKAFTVALLFLLFTGCGVPKNKSISTEKAIAEYDVKNVRTSIDKKFKDYKVEEFLFEGHNAKVVFPNTKNSNNYWIWRARFWGHEPQVDKALLEKGFHVVYVDVGNLFGNDEAVSLWDSFYNYCVTKYNLNSKVVLEGMSRGGLIIYNWASKNTDKVYAIYGDAPVCDIKSWPGGLFNGEGHTKSWENCLKAYNLDANSVKAYKDNPVDNCVRIAKAKIPVIHVYGDADTVVPYEENTAIVAEKIKKAGGIIKIIRKKGVGHHPHSLKDPTPIVEFILESVK